MRVNLVGRRMRKNQTKTQQSERGANIVKCKLYVYRRNRTTSDAKIKILLEIGF